MLSNTRTSDMEYEVKLRSDLHISRKLFHNIGILFILVIYHNLTYKQSVLTAAIMAASILSIDLLRLKSSRFHKFMMGSFKRVMRDNEVDGLTGSTYLALGVLFVVFLFPREVATLALLLLAFGDPISSIVGVTYGKDKLVGNKSLQGTLAGFAICCVVGACFYISKGIMLERVVLVSLLTGVIGAVSELIPIGKLDDNFSFPVLASCMLYVLFQLFGGFSPL